MSADIDELLVVGAVLLPTSSPADVLRDGWMLVRDGVVEAVGGGRPPRASTATQVLDARGAFVAPGFVSSHGHLATSGSRGLAADSALYDWCTAMYGITRKASAEDIYWCTLHGALDCLSNGVTTVFDFSEARLPWEPMVEGARVRSTELRPLAFALRQVDAKIDSGVRFVNAVPLNDGVGSREEVLSRFEDVLRHTAQKDPRFALRTAIAGAVQWSEDPLTAETEVAAMRSFGVMNQAHFLETPEVLEQQLERFEWYDRAGALGPDLVFGHFVQATDTIIQRVAHAGCGMSWQPGANGRLGSGVAPIPALREAGIRIGLGLDDQACSDIADPWQNMRLGLYGVRAAAKSAEALAVQDVLHAHTLGAAEVLGIDDRLGTLEPGRFADFVVVDPRRPDIGPVWDPIASYVLACGLRNLDAVYVGGRLEARAGRSVRPLAARAAEELHGRLRELNPDRAPA